MEPGGGSWRGFHEGLATSAGAAGRVIDLLAYPLQGTLKHWGALPPSQPPPHYQEDGEQHHQRYQHQQDG